MVPDRQEDGQGDPQRLLKGCQAEENWQMALAGILIQ